MVARLEEGTSLGDRAETRLERRVEALVAAGWLAWVAVALGVLLRAIRYLENRSLWLDESYLALNILDKSFSGLLGELDYLQSAPPGFLLAEKAVVTLVGDDELALRLLPFGAGIVGLVLFLQIARRLLPPAPALLAVTVFAVGEPLVYYSAEVKPYALDVAVALALLVLYLRLPQEAARTVRELVPLAAAGAVAVWFSYPSAFVLASLGLALLVRAARRREPRQLELVVATGALWLVSFAVLYLTSPTIGAIEQAIFEPGGLPGSGGGGFSFVSTVEEAWGSLVDPGGFPRVSNWLAASVLAVGLAVTARRRPLTLLVLAGPGLLAFVAAVTGKYPAGGRFWLFLVPFGLLLLAVGVERLARLAPRPAVGGAVLAVLVLVGPLVRAGDNLVAPPRSEHVRPLLHELSASWRSGDTLYVHTNAQFALRYYTECEGCDAGAPFPWPTRVARPPSGGTIQTALVSVPPSTIVGTRDPQGEELVEELSELRGRARVWVLFTHDLHRNQEVALEYLDRNGTRLEERQRVNAALFLYDLR